MARVEYMYNERFEENILIVGQTGCSKTTFVQNLAKSNLFGELKEIFWILKISLSSERERERREREREREREDKIGACFKNPVEFKYPNNIEDFNMYLDFYQRKRDTESNDTISMREDNVFNMLIVLDDVSGLADKLSNFANFLTVFRKFNFTCLYDFHTIYPIKTCWQMILSHTKIFNIFPGSLQTSLVIKILSSYCNRYPYEYIPHRDLWLYRLYFEISNSSKKQCLTIYIGHVNDLGLAKFRTGAKNDKEQVCYHNYNKKYKDFNRFLAARKQASTDAIIFSIVNLIDKSKNHEDTYFKAGDELRESNNVSIHPEQRI